VLYNPGHLTLTFISRKWGGNGEDSRDETGKSNRRLTCNSLSSSCTSLSLLSMGGEKPLSVTEEPFKLALRFFNNFLVKVVVLLRRNINIKGLFRSRYG